MTAPALIDPRTNPKPPYRGADRPLAKALPELAELLAACRQGRLYDVEAWIARGLPLQLAPEAAIRGRRTSALLTAIAEGNVALLHLLLCNGYRCDLEPSSPLNYALDSRRRDMLELLLDWGADPASVDLSHILDSYDRELFERFWAAGVDLTAQDAMADALAHSTRNRPLYGFAKQYRERDPRIKRALDVGLATAIEDGGDRAISLCLWAGADPRHPAGKVGDPEDDAWGMTAFERSVSRNAPELLPKLGFNPRTDDVQVLYGSARDIRSLKALVEFAPPDDWDPILARLLSWLAIATHFSFRSASVHDLAAGFALGGQLRALDRRLKRDVRRLLLELDDYDAQHLLRLLAEPKHMERTAFLDLIAHEKLAERYMKWPALAGLTRGLLAELASASGVPRAIRRRVEEHPSSGWSSSPPRTETYLEIPGGEGRQFSRDELYALVWSEPILVLAKRFGMSDNGLRKRCRALRVPTPPRGYWEKLQAGRRVKPLPLPALNPSTPRPAMD